MTRLFKNNYYTMVCCASLLQITHVARGGNAESRRKRVEVHAPPALNVFPQHIGSATKEQSSSKQPLSSWSSPLYYITRGFPLRCWLGPWLLAPALEGEAVEGLVGRLVDHHRRRRRVGGGKWGPKLLGECVHACVLAGGAPWCVRCVSWGRDEGGNPPTHPLALAPTPPRFLTGGPCLPP